MTRSNDNLELNSAVKGQPTETDTAETNEGITFALFSRPNAQNAQRFNYGRIPD